jgi:hypothetical protein
VLRFKKKGVARRPARPLAWANASAPQRVEFVGKTFQNRDLSTQLVSAEQDVMRVR